MEIKPQESFPHGFPSVALYESIRPSSRRSFTTVSLEVCTAYSGTPLFFFLFVCVCMCTCVFMYVFRYASLCMPIHVETRSWHCCLPQIFLHLVCSVSLPLKLELTNSARLAEQQALQSLFSGSPALRLQAHTSTPEFLCQCSGSKLKP